MKKHLSTYILVLLLFSFIFCKSQEIKKPEIIQTPKSFNLPIMDGFYPGNNALNFPKSKTTIYY